MWLLVLLTLGGQPTIVETYEHANACRAQSIARNNPNRAPRPDPTKRYACFALDSTT